MKETTYRRIRTIFMTMAACLCLSGPAKAEVQADTIQTNVPALKNVYANDFTIGCLLSYRHIGFPGDPPVPGQSPVIAPNGGKLIQFHMNCMSPGNNMKPQYTVDLTASAIAYNEVPAASKDSADTHPVIRFNGDMIAQLNWAERQGFAFRGHTLVWHSQTPAAFFRSGYISGGTRLTREKMTARMENYIKEIFRLIHEGWPGLLTAVDVVNEAVNENGTDRTSDSEWHATFGDNSYLMKAFELARKYTVQYGESQIKLYYNDYSTHTPSKADGIVRICTPIYRAGYLDGIGMQEHDGSTSPTAEQWIASYDKFYPICSEMAVTELDVTTGSANPSSSALAQQANQYGQLFKCFVERSYFSGRGKIINVSKDGLNDQYTFKTNQASSLWDANNQCKPAFHAVVDVGLHYNALDSLITHADGMHENEYTNGSWSALTMALAAAKSAAKSSYSASISAADALRGARNGLQAALDGLVKTTSGVPAEGGSIPKTFDLSQNFPNPFNPNTKIGYSIPVAARVSLKVFNMTGQEAATLFDGFQNAGNYVAVFDGAGLAGGVYFYQLQSGNVTITKKFALMK
jgi:GH35 family endo-1,4-beta-xylanase